MIQVVKKSLSYFKPYKWMIVLGLIFGTVGSVLNIFVPRYVKNISSIIQAGLYSQIDLQLVWNTAFISAVFIIIGFLCSFAQNILMSTATRHMTQDMRSVTNDKMDRIPVAYYDATSLGDTLSRVTDDIKVFTEAISSNFSTLIFACIMSVGCVIMMLTLNVVLTICVVVSVLLGTYINNIIVMRGKSLFRTQRKIIGKMNGDIEECFTGHMVIKAYNCEDEVLEQFYENNKILYESTWKSQFLMGIMAPLMAFISNFAYVIVCIVGAILITGNKTDLGTIVAFILYVRMFSTPISQFAQNMGGIQPAIASAERVFEFLELDEDIDEGEKVSDQIKGRVTFEHVKFGYVPNRLILKDFSAVVEPGMKVAIVGPTGAGKSTLVNLLMRFYEVNSGNIYIDGVSIRDMSRETLHGILAMVLQETWCFNGTIRDNIVYSNADISDDRLLGVVDEVGLSFMVEGLPDGVDTVISDQSSISSGQRQLITIARAMLKNSPIMILDEATSSVDTRTEKYIQSSIDALTKGRTSFVIAHRLSTIQNADVIFVLKDGDIIEVGKHDELIKNGGFYSELYYSQFDVGN
jgi:ATP-binding cassette subfamily B protein